MAKVKVYGTPTCPWCHKAQDYFKSKGVEFEYFDVAEDEAARNEMVEKSGQMGVPVIVIGEKVIVGLDKEAIDTELKK